MEHNLLNKYWNAETSLEEEQKLLQDMTGMDSPESGYAAFIHEARKQKSRLTVEDIKAFHHKQIATNHKPLIRPLYRSMAAAAAILVFAVATIGLWNYSQQTTQPAEMAETFDDPYEAYEEVRQALAFVSSKLNKSQSEAMIQIHKAGEYAEMFK